MEDVLLCALGRRQEVAAVSAEDQGTNRGHGVVVVSVLSLSLSFRKAASEKMIVGDQS